jgi:hypothetical protein
MRTIPTILAAATIVAALGNSPPAQADPVGDQHDMDVQAYGVNGADSVCQSITNNPTPAGIDAVLAGVKQASGFDDADVVHVVRLSIRAKCQQFQQLSPAQIGPLPSQHGLDVEAYTVNKADSVCQSIANNPTVAGIDAAVVGAKQASGFSEGDAGEVVGLAIRARCQQFRQVGIDWMNTPQGHGRSTS